MTEREETESELQSAEEKKKKHTNRPHGGLGEPRVLKLTWK